MHSGRRPHGKSAEVTGTSALFVWHKKIATPIFVEDILTTLEIQYPTILHLLPKG